MAAGYVACPHCNVSIPYDVQSCPSCKKIIQRCRKCGFFIYPGKASCVQCGAFVANEPRITCAVWVEGGDIVGDERIIRMRIENAGNIPTNAKIAIELPQGVKPNKIADTVQNLYPLSYADKAFTFTNVTPGEYLLENLKIIYTKSSGEEDTVVLKPISITIYGRPIIQVSVEKPSMKLKLGDTGEFLATIVNTGTENALDIKLMLEGSSELVHLDPNLAVRELKTNEEKTALLRIKPLFTGGYTCNLKALYSSPATGVKAGRTFESSAKMVNLEVTR